MRNKAIGVCFLLVIFIFSACTIVEGPHAQKETTISTNQLKQIEITKPKTIEVQDFTLDCSKVVIPSNVERNTNLDKEKGLLTVHWYDNSKSKDVGVIFRYGDQNCSESAIQLIQYALKTESSPNSPEGGEVKKKEDNSIRAVGTQPEGRLIVRPLSKASVAPLGVPSCYGQETDLDWDGDYEVVWESKADGTSSKVLTFPNDFDIIQRDDKPVEMQTFTLGDTDIFAYVPRYTDCHALETYLFGVSGGKAFPIPFEMEPKRILTSLGQLPIRSFQVTNGELIITGGYGAGMEFIEVYHFRYDLKKRSMILQNTDQVKPNDIL